jgi:hypothetical protein
MQATPEAPGFLDSEPVPKPHTQLLGTFHTSDTGGEFRTEQASVCGLVGEPSYCSKPSIDRSRSKPPILEKNAVAGDHSLGSLLSRGTEAVQSILVLAEHCRVPYYASWYNAQHSLASPIVKMG